MASASTAYEEEYWEPDEEPWVPDPTADFLAQSVYTSSAGAGLRHLRAPVTTPLFTVAPTAYTLVRSVDGATAIDVLGDAGLPADGVSQYEAMPPAAVATARRVAVHRDGS